jgi:methylthioribose-1-phosphate isomerase
VPIEQRDGSEVSQVTGRLPDGRIESVSIVPPGTRVANYAFDVTPARLVTGLITERGIVAASESALARAFPEESTGPAA